MDKFHLYLKAYNKNEWYFLIYMFILLPLMIVIYLAFFVINIVYKEPLIFIVEPAVVALCLIITLIIFTKFELISLFFNMIVTVGYIVYSCVYINYKNLNPPDLSMFADPRDDKLGANKATILFFHNAGNVTAIIFSVVLIISVVYFLLHYKLFSLSYEQLLRKNVERQKL